MGRRDRLVGWIVGSLAISAGAPLSAWAQSVGPNMPLGPNNTASPTPAAPVAPELPPFYGNGPPGYPENMPPFTAPLPPAVVLPEPIRIPAAVPPSEREPPKTPIDVPSTIPARPVRPAPLQFPELPDEAQPPAGGLRQSLSEYDRGLGLGGSGPLVSLARQVAMSEWVMGDATFEVIVDRSGVVRSARVVDASRDTSGWRRFGEELVSASTPLGMRLPERARGTWTLLQVSADNELSSGHRRWWSPGAFLTFDIADTQARTRRTIHTHVLGEVWF